MTAREGNCLLAEAMDEYNRNRSGGSDASARGMKAVLKLAHERFASSESITAIAIQIDGKPVYLPTWCAERVRKALEAPVFDMPAEIADYIRKRTHVYSTITLGIAREDTQEPSP